MQIILQLIIRIDEKKVKIKMEKNSNQNLMMVVLFDYIQ